MFSLNNSVPNSPEISSKAENSFKRSQGQINRTEFTRNLDIINDLKNDENRMKKCVDRIEVIHRDLFVLPEAEVKQNETDTTSTTNDEVNGTQYSVTEPGSSGNEHFDFNEPGVSMPQTNSSTGGQNSARRRLILKIPKLFLNLPSYLDEFSSDESNNDEEELTEIVQDELNNGNELNDGENEIAKQVILDFLDDKEKEITELVLDLISKFSTFQHRLRAAESILTPAIIYFPNGPNANFKRLVKKLNRTVLKLDKAVNNIFEKYSEMLESLHNAFK